MRPTALIALALIASGGTPVWGAEAPAATVLRVETLSTHDAATALRSLAGVRKLEIVDDHTLRTTDGADTVAIAKAVLEVIEHPAVGAAENSTRPLSDGSVLAAVRLNHASPSDVMLALRKLGTARIAVLSGPATVAFRDTPAKAEAALNAIREMESAPSK